MTDDLNLIAAGIAREFGLSVERDDPLAWAKARDVFLWSAQRELLGAVVGSRQVGAPAGHGVGKSFTAAVLMSWAGDTAAAGDTFVLTTAPTGPQLQNIWRPFKRMHQSLNLPGRVTGGPVPEWKIDGHLVAQGRTTRDTDPHSLSGPHAERMIVIVDEADGVAAAVWEQIGGMLTGEFNRLFALGNPRNPKSRWRSMIDAGGWFVRSISQLDSPNMTGEVVPDKLRAEMPSLESLEDRRRDYGEGSPLWKSRVEGIWPADAERQVLSAVQVEAAIRYPDSARETDAHVFGDDRPLYSVDVARMGKDRTVIGRVVNREFSIEDTVVVQDTAETAAKVRRLLEAHPGARAVVDGDGIGGGVIDTLNAAGFRGRVIEFRGGGAARDSKRYANLRAEALWSVGPILDSGRLRIAPDSRHLDELRDELVTPSYFEDKSGRIVIEKKDDIKRRLGRSPDFSDTLMMACHALGPSLRRSGGEVGPSGNGHLLREAAEPNEWEWPPRPGRRLSSVNIAQHSLSVARHRRRRY